MHDSGKRSLLTFERLLGLSYIEVGVVFIFIAVKQPRAEFIFMISLIQFSDIYFIAKYVYI